MPFLSRSSKGAATPAAFLLILFILFVHCQLWSSVASAYEPGRNLKGGLGLLVDRESQLVFAVSAVAVASSFSLDDEAQDYFDHKGRLGGWEKLGNDSLGTGVPGVLIGGGFWLAGDLGGSSRHLHAGQAQIEALLVTGVLAAAMKGVVGRERPDGADRYSFPSGHVSTWFTTASVLSSFYGWKAGVPLYMLGALTVAGRLSENKHWLSDTVGGAALGVLVGRAFARLHLRQMESEKPNEEPAITVLPALEPGGGRLTVRFDW